MLGSTLVAITPPFVRDPLWVRARQVPTFDLDFTSGTPVNRGSLAAGNLGTFTRPSSVKLVWNGTQYVEVPADTIALQRDPVSGLWGVLMEPAATNNILFSNDISTSNGFNANNVTTGTGTRDLGALGVGTALRETSATSGHEIFRLVNMTSGLVYTTSAIVEEAGRQFVRLFYGTVSGLPLGDRTVYVDMFNGVITQAPSGSSTARIVQLLPGVFRVSLTITASATSGGVACGVSLSEVGTGGGNPPTFTGDPSLGCNVWALQSELGPVATSPIITTGSTVTRAADSMTVSGADFSRWFVPGGVLYGEFTPNELLDGTIASIDDGTFSNRVQLRFMQSGGLRARYRWVSPSSNLDQPATNAISVVTSKMTLSCGLDRRGASDGIVYDPGPTATLPTVTRMTVGSAVAADSSPVAIHRLTYFPPGNAQSRIQQLSSV